MAVFGSFVYVAVSDPSSRVECVAETTTGSTVEVKIKRSGFAMFNLESGSPVSCLVGVLAARSFFAPYVHVCFLVFCRKPFWVVIQVFVAGLDSSGFGTNSMLFVDAASCELAPHTFFTGSIKGTAELEQQYPVVWTSATMYTLSSSDASAYNAFVGKLEMTSGGVVVPWVTTVRVLG